MNFIKLILVILSVSLFAACDGSEASRSSASPQYPSFYITPKVFWGVYTNGSRPKGIIDIQNASGMSKYYGIELLFLNKDGKIMTTGNALTSNIPPGMTEQVIIDNASAYVYPEETWSYILRVDGVQVGSGKVPVDYAGEME